MGQVAVEKANGFYCKWSDISPIANILMKLTLNYLEILLSALV